MNNHAKVLFFATLRDKAGVRETTVEFPPGTKISDIKALILQLFPGLSTHMETIIVAMDHEFAFDDHIVQDGAEIAFFPPVSGGELTNKLLPTIILLVDHNVDVNDIVGQLSLETTGAACVFTGIVRGVTQRGNPHHTEELEYEAYQKMAESKMLQISEEIRTRWNEVEGIALIQRTGRLNPGQVSVVVACTGSHRDSGIFEAARYGIDRLKEIVPIWKKEIVSGKEEWVEGHYLPGQGE